MPSPTRTPIPILLLSLFLLLSFSSAARAADWTDAVKFSGWLDSDIRHTLDDTRGADGEGYAFQMNRNAVKLRLDIFPADNVRAVLETRMIFYGFSNAGTVDDITHRERIDPYHVQLDEAYLHAREVGWEGLDIKVGRMIQNWGKVDMFNPTDNLNGRDLSDPLDFTAKMPNQMVEIDLYPADWVSFNLVWIPVFKPTQLPDSADFAFAVDYDGNGCFSSAPAAPLSPSVNRELEGVIKKNLPAKDFEALLANNGIQASDEDLETLRSVFQVDKHYRDFCRLNFLPPEVRTVTPSLTMRNSMAAAKVNFSVSDFEFSLSYFYGRHTFPVAYDAVAEISDDPEEWYTFDKYSIDKSKVDPAKLNVKYVAETLYPRVHVAGFDFSYTSEYVADIGFTGEMAVYFPEKTIFALRAYQDGEKLLERSGVNVPKTPFIKGVFGMDYTWTSWLYTNLMYARGMFDEFNDRYGIHNYIVPMVGLTFLDSELKIQVSGAFTPDDLSAFVYPQLTWIPHPSVELIWGAMVNIGDTELGDPYDYASRSRFGHRTAGRNVGFMKARVTW